MKRILALILCMVMCLSVMTACGSEPANNTAEPAGTETPAEAADGTETPAETTADIDWPKKTIELLCPYSAGGDSDTFLRAAATVLGRELGVNVVVTNLGGNTVGVLRETNANEADGYTVMYYNSTLLAKQATGATEELTITDDFIPAGSIAYDATYAVMVRTDSGFTTMADIVSFLKENPKKLSFAISNKAATHYLMLALQDATGVEFNGIDAGSDNATRTLSLLSGEVDVILGNYANFADYITDGQLTCLGIMAAERNPALPDVPTLVEQGIDVEYTKYYSFRFKNGTDQAIVDKFTEALSKVQNDEDFRRIVESYIGVVNFQTPEEQQEYDTWAVADQEKYWAALE